VEKCGSIGKNTDVSDSDIDVVVYINQIDVIKYLLYHNKILETFEKMIVESLKVPVKKKTQYSVQFIYKETEIDLLPTFKNNDVVPTEFEKFLSNFDKKNRSYFSSWFGKKQRDEVKIYCNKHPELRNNIRRLKNIINSNWIPGVRTPSSYLLEILLIYSYETKENNITITAALKSLLDKALKKTTENFTKS